ncbi:MAG: dimethyl sulfoxide reductase anchor subunit [Acidobacteriota bacterium]|nr:dimethyl sulfoxide reductase anchor subunit [Acidobacteriota bacterium]
MALPLYERATETDSVDLVRLTLLAGGAAPALVESLIPTRPLESGEQYRFHFDMTKCIGCRSCEIACNEQNGNPADIKWRRVGELEGGTYPDTQRTYLSMGCNHCISADCLRGCPVDAFSKDPMTGIVLHSADACIGCQYCVWNCPYSVPQFNPERGVVGKCDMCRGRLLDGREPACVNACPENAIQIEIVNTLEWKENYALADSPGMPPAAQTLSTTRITLPKGSATWLERVDTGAIPLEHAHPSLVAMTTMMQTSFGSLCILILDRSLNAIFLTMLLLLTTIAMNVSVFHLGRPAYAWRALKMWRRSWLSREVLCFGLFFAAITACSAASWATTLGFANTSHLVTPLAIVATVFGLCGTLASACIYLVPARPSWNMIHTPIDFVLSSLLIGIPFVSAMPHYAALVSPAVDFFGAPIHSLQAAPHVGFAAIVAALWLANQVVRAYRLHASSVFELHAAFSLLRGYRLRDLVVTSWLAAGTSWLFLAASLPTSALITAFIAVAVSRYLFFVSVVPLSMGLTFLKGKSGVRGVAA